MHSRLVTQPACPVLLPPLRRCFVIMLLVPWAHSTCRLAVVPGPVLRPSPLMQLLGVCLQAGLRLQPQQATEMVNARYVLLRKVIDIRNARAQIVMALGASAVDPGAVSRYPQAISMAHASRSAFLAESHQGLMQLVLRSQAPCHLRPPFRDADDGLDRSCRMQGCLKMSQICRALLCGLLCQNDNQTAHAAATLQHNRPCAGQGMASWLASHRSMPAHVVSLPMAAVAGPEQQHWRQEAACQCGRGAGSCPGLPVQGHR